MFSALRHSNFRLFWLNGATQAMAQGMQFLILGWLVLDITGSSYQLGLVIFAFGLPNIPFALLGGVIADRGNRLKLLILTRICVSTLIFALAILRISDLLDIWHVYAVVFLLGTIQGLNMPARQAIVADLVERDDMMNAVALHTMVNQTGQIIGPAAAGGIIELVGIGPTLLVNAGLYLSGIGFLLFITGLPRRSATKGVKLLAELGAGLQCVRSTPILLTVIGMTLAFAFFALSFRQVMPAIAQEVLEIGPGGTGLLLLAVGLGSLFGNLILAGLGDFRRKAGLLMASVLLQSVFLTLFAWSPWPWVSWVILLFVGAMSFGFFVPLVVTLIQLNVPPELRGRVLSILGLAPAVHYLGALPLALAANAISWPVAVTAGAALSMLVALWLGVWRPVLRRLAE
ncbi:MAG: MFS transporter [Dehalococcoidia bacterium]|jgi:predicted MFS family arabinose efflux permease|nr:MFS transporter [Dehalococcoidia bacterium]